VLERSAWNGGAERGNWSGGTGAEATEKSQKNLSADF